MKFRLRDRILAPIDSRVEMLINSFGRMKEGGNISSRVTFPFIVFQAQRDIIALRADNNNTFRAIKRRFKLHGNLFKRAWTVSCNNNVRER